MNEEHNIMATSIIKALQKEKAVTSFNRLIELIRDDFINSVELKKYNLNQQDWAFENVVTMLQVDYSILRVVGERAMANRSFELTAKGYDVRLSPDFNGYIIKKKLFKFFNQTLTLTASAVALVISCKSLIENNLNWSAYIYILLSLLLGIIIGYKLKRKE